MRSYRGGERGLRIGDPSCDTLAPVRGLASAGADGRRRRWFMFEEQRL